MPTTMSTFHKRTTATRPHTAPKSTTTNSHQRQTSPSSQKEPNGPSSPNNASVSTKKEGQDTRGGRAFAYTQNGQILTWAKYTDNHKPLRIDNSFGYRKMALVIPKKVVEYQKQQLREPRRYSELHVSDSINIRDFIEPRATFRANQPEREYRHFNLSKYI